MGPGTIVKLIEHDKDLMEHFTWQEIATYFGHSFLLGVILTISTYYLAVKIAGDKLKPKKKNKLILGSSNIIFICVGITALMILVNNNLARAFAIGASLGLIRFRVKLGPKSLSSNLLFAIIAGIACGVQQVNIAWITTGLYLLIQFTLLMMMDRSQEGLLGFDDEEK